MHMFNCCSKAKAFYCAQGLTTPTLYLKFTFVSNWDPECCMTICQTVFIEVKKSECDLPKCLNAFHPHCQQNKSLTFYWKSMILLVAIMSSEDKWGKSMVNVLLKRQRTKYRLSCNVQPKLNIFLNAFSNLW